MAQKLSKNIYYSVLSSTKSFYGSFLKHVVSEKNEPDIDRKILDALSENSPTITLLFDHRNLSYAYFSPNVKEILGYNSEDFISGGLKFAMSLVDEQHTRIYNRHIIPLMFRFYALYGARFKIKEIRFSYTFKIKRKDGSYIWAMHHMNAIETNKMGFPKFTLVNITDVTELKKDDNVDLVISRKDKDGIYRAIYSKVFNDTANSYSFSHRELEILTCIAKGKTSKQIAGELNLSIHTINSHRKNMLEKSKLNNTTELIQIAIKKNMILS